MKRHYTFHERTMYMNFNDDHDHETPDCPMCGESVGMHNDAVLMLPGQFFFNKEEGYAMFVLDPDLKVAFLEIPNALGDGQSQFAIVVDKEPSPGAVAHAPCVEDELALVEEEDEDSDDLDAQMRDALDRDPDLDWDEHDMLVPNEG